MNKMNLNKLSKSQLIELLLKQQKKPKEVVKKKKKVVYNHENLFNEDPFPDYVVTNDPFERSMIKVNNRKRDIDEKLINIDTKYNNLMSKTNQVNDTVSTQKIRNYPMIKATLDDFRRSEIRISTDKNRAKVSFIKLFKTRLDKIPGKREMVSISLDVEVNHTSTSPVNNHIQDDREQYERQPKYMSKREIDEFNIEYKKVIKQTFYKGDVGDMGDHYIRKVYGPFTVEKPVNLSKLDVYKLAMYTLLNNKFSKLSQEVISGIGCKIIKLDKKQIKHHKMGKLRLESYLLNKQRPIKSHGVNTCVVDYVWDQVRGKRGFKTDTYDKLKNEIYDYVPEGAIISTEELINWTNKCHSNVSIHAFDRRYRKFITHIKQHSDVSLVYIVKDHHCYPITDEKLKIVASKANKGGCDNLLKYMTDMKWTRRHENVTQIKSIDDIYVE